MRRNLQILGKSAFSWIETCQFNCRTFSIYNTCFCIVHCTACIVQCNDDNAWFTTGTLQTLIFKKIDSGSAIFANYVLYTVLLVLYILHVLYIVFHVLYTLMYCTLYFMYCTLYFMFRTLYFMYCTLYFIFCTLYFHLLCIVPAGYRCKSDIAIFCLQGHLRVRL